MNPFLKNRTEIQQKILTQFQFIIDFQCSKVLACGIHKCDQICHQECPPCTKKSKQKCVCGGKVMERDCNSLVWSCDKICNKFFECGMHRCKVKCHDGDCGECPNGLFRSCPCGKEVSQQTK